MDETSPLLSGPDQSDVHSKDEVDFRITSFSGRFGNVGIVDKKTGGEEDEATKFKFSQLSRQNKLVLGLLGLANFFTGCGFSLLAPFFPQEAEKKGVSTTVTGLIFSVFQFVIFLSSPVFGNYLTRIGPKFLFVSGIFVGGTCAILFGTLYMCPSGAPFIVICFVCRCVEALGLSAFLTSALAIISNEFPKHVATVFGFLETATGIGLMAGPALGGVLYEAGGFGLPFFVIGSLILATGCVMFFLLPEIANVQHERKTSVFSLLKSPMVWFASLSIMAGGIGIVFLDPTFSKHVEEFNLSTAIVGLFFVIAPGLYGLTSPLWGFISDSTGMNAPLIILGNLMCGIGFLFIGPSPLLPFLPFELWIIILGLIMVGAFFGTLVVPSMKCMLIGAIDIGFENNLDTFGVVSGLFNSVFSIGAFTGPMLAGVLVEEIGFRYGTTVVTGINFAVMLLCASYFIIRRLLRPSKSANLLIRYESAVPQSAADERDLILSNSLHISTESKKDTNSAGLLQAVHDTQVEVISVRL
ncbi:unnamed protein product [Lymnaea stagnalis]|uniref:Major facilitator superfamily (MFS) profile domain-containing protein n=1 Tax=Lymnaea stagnalis TaxID=6523 RepID=A0AAV2HRH4_LYMST